MSDDPKRRQLSLFDESPSDPAPLSRSSTRKGNGNGAIDEPPQRLSRDIEDNIPDVRDGLTRVERVILLCLKQAQEEKHGRMVSTAMLYGRVVEHVNISVPEFQRILQRLVGVR